MKKKLFLWNFKQNKFLINAHGKCLIKPNRFAKAIHYLEIISMAVAVYELENPARSRLLKK